MGSCAITVQCFIKADTLEALCESLIKCDRRDEFELIFWSDSPTGSKRPDEYRRKNEAVLGFIQDFREGYGAHFRNIEVHSNKANAGTCKTCQLAMDYAFRKNDFVVFTEDDTVFARDSLAWLLGLLDAGVMDRPDVVALAGESIFFDARRNAVPAGYPARARAAALSRGYANKFTTFDFVPSTCFATTRAKWDLIGPVRGQPHGDEDLCRFCKAEKKLCAFPIVGRVKDVGMLHADGYSVLLHGEAEVNEIKNTYLLSDDLSGPDEPLLSAAAAAPEPFAGDKDQLFRDSVMLQGFSEAAAPAPEAQAPAGPFLRRARPWTLWCFSLRNFGDALTPHLLSHYKVPFEMSESFDDADLLGIGSNLDRVRAAHQPIVVWTSGFMYEKLAAIRYADSVRFVAVRGSQTRASVSGLAERGCAVGDGGLLVRRTFPFREVATRFRLGVIPHMSDKGARALKGIAADPDVLLIDVFAPIDDVLAQVASCGMVVSSSLHGLIVADAFEIPNAFGVFEDGRQLEGDGYKYKDYGSALGRRIEPLVLQEGVTVDGICDRIAAEWKPCRHLDGIVDELEMTTAVLRASAYGLCTI